MLVSLSDPSVKPVHAYDKYNRRNSICAFEKGERRKEAGRQERRSIACASGVCAETPQGLARIDKERRKSEGLRRVRHVERVSILRKGSVLGGVGACAAAEMQMMQMGRTFARCQATTPSTHHIPRKAWSEDLVESACIKSVCISLFQCERKNQKRKTTPSCRQAQTMSRIDTVRDA